MNQRKQSTTTYPLLFLMVDATDHVTGKTGLSPTVTLSKNGAAFGAPSGAVTEISSGWYKVAGNATDSDTLGPLLLHATGTGADPTDATFAIVSHDPFAMGTAQTGDSYARLGAPAGASVSADIAAVAPAVFTQEFGPLVGTDNVAEKIQTMASDITTVGTNLGVPVGASLSADIAAVKADTAAVKAKTDNLPASPAATGDIPTAAANAAAVWDELLTPRGTADSAAVWLKDAGVAASDASAYAITIDGKIGVPDTTLAGDITVVDTVVDAIKAKTDQFVFTVANQVDANALTGSAGIDAAGVRAAVGLASANLDTQLTAIDDYLDTEVAAIKAKTDNIPAAPAAVGDLMTAAGVRSAVGLASANLDTQLTAIDDYLDTEIAAIKAKTDNLPANTATILGTPAGASLAADIASARSELATVDGVVDAIKVKTDALPASPAAVGSQMTLEDLAITDAKIAEAALQGKHFDTDVAIYQVTGTVGSVAGDVAGNVVGSVASVTAGVTLTSGERNSVADALLTRTDGVETSVTLRQATRLILSALAGKVSGAGTTTITFRNSGDTADRIVATVDTSGNRTAVTLTP